MLVHFHDFHDNPFTVKKNCSIKVTNKGLFTFKNIEWLT